jgi:predicted CoA-substrate-specific enzyme activase
MPPADREALGVCLGASSASLVRVARDGGRARILRAASLPHGGDPAAALLRVLDAQPDWRTLPVAVTGRKLKDLTRLPSLCEPEAVELAVRFALGEEPGPLTLISAGGETFMAYALDASGRVRAVEAGNKCASGTGEFFAQQLARMGLDLAGLDGLDHAAAPHGVSGRCSVFCKSDCTHALNKGAPRDAVAAGLGRMMAMKCLELIGGFPPAPLMLTGGCSANPYLTRFLREELGEVAVPEAAHCFEALGAALFALDGVREPAGEGEVLTGRVAGFAMLAPISKSVGMVDFKAGRLDVARAGDELIVGLDVGSTTTKGVALRVSDLAVVAGEYLRTDGDPVGAARRVYASLADRLHAPVRVAGLGVTGSGRAIAALHARATAAINEIVAHAAAARHYDPAVDTIFEIGGQDAKYTSFSGGHPCDAAMNEACSAGTGSFLEEAALESLGVKTADIAGLALSAARTPDFNDQCSAFIASDIKAAAQQGLSAAEILAGLVNSVCVNYITRVKGSRPVGELVFMQGGVCRNRAVPAAMARLTGKRIVVPPDPELAGALGVALETWRRIREGGAPTTSFDLRELAGREAVTRGSFVCRGGKGGQKDCDRGCEIARIEVGGEVHPFGGVCNRFENLRRGEDPDARRLDAVRSRQDRVFRDHRDPAPGRPVVGLSRSYLTNTCYPLYSTFFRELGFETVLPGRCDPEGVKRRGPALCHPAELAHGFLADLLAKKPDFLFLPHVRAVPAAGGQEVSCTCVLLQGEPFYLRSAFAELEGFGERLLTPALDFTGGFAAARGEFFGMARALGASSAAAARAFDAGIEAQAACARDLLALGRQTLKRLADEPGTPGVVIFGRSYSAFAPEANKAIPAKFATRGAMAVPCDILPLPGRDAFGMYWGQGRTIMAASKLAAASPGLYGAFITNFSCGPDSFLLGYFRDDMGAKPSLTLEVDSHTAGAGLETRIEAFLDMVDSHRRPGRTGGMAAASGRKIGGDGAPGHPASGAHGAGAAPREKSATPGAETFRPARMASRGGHAGIVNSSGRWLPMTDARARLLLPSMNPSGTAMAAAALAGCGVRAEALPPGDQAALKAGRGASSCKECLPLHLTVGTLLDYLDARPRDEVSAYFMPGALGPCRFGQYGEFTARLIEKRSIADVAVLSATADNGYAGLPSAVTLAIWRGCVVGDAMEEIRSALLACARDPDQARQAFEDAHTRALCAMRLPWRRALGALQRVATELAGVPLRAPLSEFPTVLLAGEIYVRHDPISRQDLIERLAAKGLRTLTAPVSEWIFYADWLQNQGITGRPGLMGRVRQWFKRRSHAQVLSAFAPSGLVSGHGPDIPALVRAGRDFISPLLTGEALLTVGSAFEHIRAPACGVVSIGPFGCMPTRLADAVLARRFDTDALARIHPGRAASLPPDAHGRLPFLTIETDGGPFPQLVEARLEAFCLQAMRLHDAMRR